MIIPLIHILWASDVVDTVIHKENVLNDHLHFQIVDSHFGIQSKTINKQETLQKDIILCVKSKAMVTLQLHMYILKISTQKLKSQPFN